MLRLMTTRSAIVTVEPENLARFSGPRAEVDLRGRDPQIRVIEADGRVHEWREPGAVAAQENTVLFGSAALSALVHDPGAGWDGLINRVDDLLPCRVGPITSTASELLASLIKNAIPAGISSLTIYPPHFWTARARISLEVALESKSLTPTWVQEIDAITAPTAEGQQEVLFSLGNTASLVSLLSGVGGRWTVTHSTSTNFGEYEVQENLTQTAVARLCQVSGRSLTGLEVRQISAQTRVSITTLTTSDLQITVPDLPTVTLTSDDLAASMRTGATSLAAVPAALSELGLTQAPARVLLSSSGATLPGLTALLSEALFAPVYAVGTEPSAAAVVATVEALAPEPVTDKFDPLAGLVTDATEPAVESPTLALGPLPWTPVPKPTTPAEAEATHVMPAAIPAVGGATAIASAQQDGAKKRKRNTAILAGASAVAVLAVAGIAVANSPLIKGPAAASPSPTASLSTIRPTSVAPKVTPTTATPTTVSPTPTPTPSKTPSKTPVKTVAKPKAQPSAAATP